MSEPAFTFGIGFTTTVTVSVEAHKPLLLTVTIYVVVVNGDAIGFAIVGLFNPVVGVQVNVLPLLTPNCADSPIQIVSLFVALAFVTGITVTVTVVDAVQLPFAPINVYCVVDGGVAVTVFPAVLLSVAPGAHV